MSPDPVAEICGIDMSDGSKMKISTLLVDYQWQITSDKNIAIMSSTNCDITTSFVADYLGDNNVVHYLC